MDNKLPPPSFGTELPSPLSSQPERATDLGASVAPNLSPTESPQHTERRNMELPATPQSPALPVPPVVSTPMIPTMPGKTDPTVSTAPAPPVPSAASVQAEDSDLIEKEWVIRAKTLIEHTKYDPHDQNKEINKMKAEYIKKRYNKDIKVNEE